MEFQVGDLVRYKDAPDPSTWVRSMIPPVQSNNSPVGIIVETRQCKTSSNSRAAGIISVVHVSWFDDYLNHRNSSYSEEMECHLELIQSLPDE